MNLTDIFANLDQDPREATTDDQQFSCSEPAQLDNAPRVHTFILGGNAYFTIRSKKTGQRFTYRVRASKDGRVHFVSVLTGQDNSSSYSYMGYIKITPSGGVFFHGGGKARVGKDAPSFKAFDWLYRQLVRCQLPDTVEVWHEGRCGRCARRLTVPESIRSGFGPECIGRIHSM
jgi:hypothetical protein